MIDLATETLLTIEKAAQRLLVSKATLQRWITKGSNGVRLEAAKVGGRWGTSEEAIQGSAIVSPQSMNQRPPSRHPYPCPKKGSVILKGSINNSMSGSIYGAAKPAKRRSRLPDG